LAQKLSLVKLSMLIKKHINVLIVEDDKYMNETLKEVLESEGLSVESSLGAIDALNKLVHYSKKYDLLILDYNLQHLNDVSGIDVFEVARKMNPKVIAIMISAYNNREIKEKAYSKGIRKFIEKPFMIKDLIENIKEISSDFAGGNDVVNGLSVI
jgi:DNA-binding NtrC family response regulator